MSQEIINPKLDGNLGILVGLLLTDGCVSSRQVMFHNKSDELHKLFKTKITNVFGQRKFGNGLQKNGVKITRVSDKRLVKLLLSTCNLDTFRTKPLGDEFPNSKLPEFIKELTRREICKVLQAMFTADGSISLSVRWHSKNKSWEIRRRVELSCKHPIIRQQIIDLLRSLGFSPVNSSNDNITIERKEDIQKFKKQIGFIDVVKIGRDSKLWTGFKKQQILDLAIKTFDFKKKNLQKFKTKEEVISFLKSLL